MHTYSLKKRKKERKLSEAAKSPTTSTDQNLKPEPEVLRLSRTEARANNESKNEHLNSWKTPYDQREQSKTGQVTMITRQKIIRHDARETSHRKKSKEDQIARELSGSRRLTRRSELA